jgi:hypothetical protein
MYKTISEADFIRAFEDYNREDNFSRAGLSALFDYFIELEGDIGEKIGLDVIAVCCDFTEYANLAEFQSDYDKEYESIDDIEAETTVIKLDEDAFIIEQF